MSVIYRPHRGSLSEAMKDVVEFDTFQDLQKHIVKDMEQVIKLNECEIVPAMEPSNDTRIGWRDSDYLCIDSYDKVADKKGYKLYFGGEYDCPLCIGMFATDYIKQRSDKE